MNRLAVAALLLLAPAVAFADDVAVIVGFHGEADGGIFARHGGRAVTDLAGLGAQSGVVPSSSLGALASEPGVAYVEEDLVRSRQYVPNDKYYATDPRPADANLNSQAGAFALINAPAAWDTSKGSGVRIAVLDTGSLLSHVDIGSGASGKVKAWKNFTTGKATDASDKDGHGSHTSGTCAARTDNTTGVASAGFNAELAIGKVLSNAGRGSDSTVAAGIAWAWQAAGAGGAGAPGGGAKVISMSLGGPGSSVTLDNAVSDAWNLGGCVIVAAAGNDAVDGSNFYPAASPHCISVGATDDAGRLASFSNFGSSVDIAAPGVYILSTYKNGGYAWMSGTSMACPHVAGVAALIWATPHGTSNASVRSRIEATATRAVTGANAGTLKVLDAAAAVRP